METATEAPVLTLAEHVRDRLDAALAGIRISCQEEAIPGPNIIQACVSEPVEAYPVREDKIPELADRLADALTKTLLNRGKKLSPKQELICWPGEINILFCVYNLRENTFDHDVEVRDLARIHEYGELARKGADESYYRKDGHAVSVQAVPAEIFEPKEAVHG